MTMMRWGYVPNTKKIFRAEMIPRKQHFWSLLALTIAVCQIQMILTLIPLKISMMGWGYVPKTKKIFRAEMIFRKQHFWSKTNAVCHIQMILTLIPLQKQHVGMEICAKHTNFILS